MNRVLTYYNKTKCIDGKKAMELCMFPFLQNCTVVYGISGIRHAQLLSLCHYFHSCFDLPLIKYLSQIVQHNRPRSREQRFCLSVYTCRSVSIFSIELFRAIHAMSNIQKVSFQKGQGYVIVLKKILCNQTLSVLLLCLSYN